MGSVVKAGLPSTCKLGALGVAVSLAIGTDHLVGGRVFGTGITYSQSVGGGTLNSRPLTIGLFLPSVGRGRERPMQSLGNVAVFSRCHMAQASEFPA